MAIENFPHNYLQSPFNLFAYSTIVVDNPEMKAKFSIESALKGYYDGYKLRATKKFEILNVRQTGNNPLNGELYAYWPSYEMYSADVISSPFYQGVFNLKNIDSFKFTFIGLTMYEADTVFNIEYFVPEPTKKNTGYGIVPKKYAGSLFIKVNDYAVIKHMISTDSLDYQIIYKKMDGFISLIS